MRQNSLTDGERHRLLIRAKSAIGEMPICFPFEGKCRCGCDLIDRFANQLNQDTPKVITGCPECHRSYCE